MTEKNIFIVALQLTDPEARSAYLTQACGSNTALRHRIEVLLRAYERVGDFLSATVVHQLADALNHLRRSSDLAP